MNFECTVAGMLRDSFAEVAVFDDFALLRVDRSDGTGAQMNLEEKGLRVLSIALNMAADELKERSNAAR